MIPAGSALLPGPRPSIPVWFDDARDRGKSVTRSWWTGVHVKCNMDCPPLGEQGSSREFTSLARVLDLELNGLPITGAGMPLDPALIPGR